MKKRLGFYIDKQEYFNFYRTMKIRDEAIDNFFMEVVQLLSENYDTTLDRATNVAEQIAEMVNEMIEGDDA